MNNKEILELYIPLVDFLGKICGINYEIILHDTANTDSSIVAIANGNISGRKIGGPMSDIALKYIKEGTYKNKDFVVNEGRTKDGKTLISSTMFIKNENDKLVALLCVNNNITELVSINKYLTNLIAGYGINTQNDNEKEVYENLYSSLDDVMDSMIKDTLSNIDMPPERMTPEEKIELVHKLNGQGFFLLKGAVSRIAKYLKTSDTTIYRYLNKKD
ncbi:helix-turn-helix transcriptional regulator [Clostridium luticellarii]|jgi:predicted transcriptional regulator YheO|uniref:helix-turn-helix transcriptional regulator n=1 Tax=Clostridium luticellarii TaxID=1691940 RepID=UPI0023528C12|nr:PAS domain-containing protein [Clostridium luticellarii]MCI1946478.1 PAS domain-containing protein [Clostridium luticellarii]MCI1969701.1 PAS domain-containing protein [Clostridium luticellarii]MCI1996336.1 PAS domain-containing protein [Clostridium luticellarii]MCI2040663.1 PAS domain-containing protein [Clostridium luticellarii]